MFIEFIKRVGERDKMQGLPSILSLFRNEMNIYNNTRARMLDSIKISLKSHFCRKNVLIVSLFTQRRYGRHNVFRNSVNHWWFIDFIAWRYITPRCDILR